MDKSNLIKLDIKKKIIAISILLPASIAVIIFFVVIPAINDIKTIKDEIEFQRTDLETKYQRGQSVNKLTRDLEVINPQLEDLNEIFIDSKKVLEFITILESIATKSNVTQKINLVSDNVTKKESFQKIPLQIITNGTYSDQLNYLLELESLPYYININVLDISSNSGQLNLLIFADTYWN